MNFAEVRDSLKSLGIHLKQVGDEYRLSYWRQIAKVMHVTADLQDALERGRHMALNPPAPPMGPLGNSNTKRAETIKHNRRYLKKRIKAIVDVVTAEIGARVTRK